MYENHDQSRERRVGGEEGSGVEYYLWVFGGGFNGDRMLHQVGDTLVLAVERFVTLHIQGKQIEAKG